MRRRNEKEEGSRGMRLNEEESRGLRRNCYEDEWRRSRHEKEEQEKHEESTDDACHDTAEGQCCVPGALALSP